MRHGGEKRGNAAQRRERRMALLADPRFQGTWVKPGQKRGKKTVPGVTALCQLGRITPGRLCEGIVDYATMNVDQIEPGKGYGGKRDGYANCQPACWTCNRFWSSRPKPVGV